MVGVANLWDTATTVNTTAVITSNVVSNLFNVGHASLLVIVTGTTPSLDITFTVGKERDSTFYSPVDGNGTSLGTIYSGLTTSAWITFSPFVAPFMKVVITGTVTNGADTTVRAYMMYQEDTGAM